MNTTLVELIEYTAQARGENPVPREFIIKALEDIEDGKANVERYPSGFPSLRGIFELAQELYKKSLVSNASFSSNA